jgi:hypothetical protein
MPARVRWRGSADDCPVCHEPLPRGRDLSWPVIAGIFLGFWRGYIWMPGGFAHRHCFDAMVRTATWRTSRTGTGWPCCGRKR